MKTNIDELIDKEFDAWQEIANLTIQLTLQNRKETYKKLGKAINDWAKIRTKLNQARGKVK